MQATEPLALTILDEAQRAEKAECEQIIRSGMRSFLDVGRALARIQDGHLYADEYQTFEDYCRQKLKMSRSYGYRMIEAASVAQNVSPIGDIEKIIPNEAVARELAILTPAEQRKAARMLAKDGDVTAPKARQTAQRIRRVKPKETETQAEIEQPFTRAQAASMIDAWWNENRRHLESQPPAVPSVVVRRILALFNQ